MVKQDRRLFKYQALMCVILWYELGGHVSVTKTIKLKKKKTLLPQEKQLYQFGSTNNISQTQNYKLFMYYENILQQPLEHAT